MILSFKCIRYGSLAATGERCSAVFLLNRRDNLFFIKGKGISLSGSFSYVFCKRQPVYRHHTPQAILLGLEGKCRGIVIDHC